MGLRRLRRPNISNTHDGDEDNIEVEFIESTSGRGSKIKIKPVPVSSLQATPDTPRKRKRGDAEPENGVVASDELPTLSVPHFAYDDHAPLSPSRQDGDASDDDNGPPPVFMEGITQSHTGKTSQGRTTHEYMDAWARDHSESYLAALLEREGRCASSCESCGFGDAEMRCLDCISTPRLCRDCCRLEHRRSPLHRIETWVKNRWQPSWMWQVGAVICLGHGLSPCPYYKKSREDIEAMVIRMTAQDLEEERTFPDDPTYGARPTTGQLGGACMMTVVHTNGFHEVPVFQCFCSGAPSFDIQLVKSNLYPATSAEPQTVFTFELLKHLHLSIVDSQVSVEHYCALLRRLSNYVFPSQSKERQREITRVWQQYNYLVTLKRHGMGIVSLRISPPGKGELALFCAVCPQPGVNIPDNWRDLDDPWRFWRFLTADGNFVLDHLMVNDPDNAVWLMNGAGYFAERTRFNSFIGDGKEGKDTLTCNQLRAITDKNKGKKGFDSTGILACACTRHGCFAPGSVVDMQKGERYAYTGAPSDSKPNLINRQKNGDYSLAQAYETTGAALLLGLMFAYDVNCQYCVKFRARFQDPVLKESIPSEAVIVFLIGLFHVHGHKEDCLARFAPTFTPGAGVVAGEILESLWSTLIGVANSTRNMTAAHRVAVLDACMADSNWKKLLNMGTSHLYAKGARSLTRLSPVAYLLKQYADAKKGIVIAEKDFALVDKNCSAEQRTQWEAVMEDAHAKRVAGDVTAMDIYKTESYEAEGQQEAQVQLMKQERKMKTRRGVAEWIAKGIQIQSEQIDLRGFVKGIASDAKPGAAAIEAERKRASLLKKIEAFYEKGTELFDGLDLEELSADSTKDRNLCVCEDPVNECNCEEELGRGGDQGDQGEGEAEVEDIPIPLPSTALELPRRWKPEVGKEERLRVAQAHEALESLRGLIAHKSYLYRGNKKLASGKRGRKTIYGQINTIETAMRLQCNRYDLARGALIRLKALERYPELEELTNQDTRAVITIWNPNARGQRDSQLTWIWKIHVPSSDPNAADKYVQDLYRVNWIRARSRVDRWKEEVKMLESEMDWFVRFCKHRHVRATGWALNGVTAGHSAYAYRQANMWYRLGRYAAREFEKKGGVIVDAVF